MLMVEADRYPRFRAPPNDGQTLVDPPRASLSAVVARNRAHLAGLQCSIQGKPLAELAAAARRSLVEQAVDYTRQYRRVSSRHLEAQQTGGPIVLSGHQPQLFHAGVWYKNFVLGSLAEEVGGAAIHLLIDSDLCRTASIRVPTGTVDAPVVESAPFDGARAEMPFEERTVADEAIFRAFPGRVGELIHPFVDAPIVIPLWSLVMESVAREPNLGRRVARGRHRLEEQMGNETLELPQSHVCRLPEFRWFAAHLLANLPRFRSAYNDALAEYRRAHGLRNRAHPVPDLAQSGDWLEAPFWMWTADDPRRQPVFSRERGSVIEITNRRDHTIALSLSSARDAGVAVEQLADAETRGIKLRTRALATTLFARLVLCDLFLHGIGGAKYDQVTDGIAARFFGIALPEYATASATLRLPIQHPLVRGDELRSVRQQFRELRYHPERFLTDDQQSEVAAELVAEKRRWIAVARAPQTASRRHAAIVAANASLQRFVATQRMQLERERERIERRLDADALLDSREYSFCLFPRAHVERLLRS